MQRQLTTIADLKLYLTGLFYGREGDSYPRIQHAEKTVGNVVIQVAGCLVMCADDDSVRVTQRIKPGTELVRDQNMLRFSVSGRSYFMAYANRAIEIRQDTRWGKTLARIDNSTSDLEILVVFQTLATLDGSNLDAKIMAGAKAIA
ncbi:MAG TPA: hypothetical protein VKE42_05595, partial [Candidatus Cybelea sp.]|nr:hypothetical protein [Candidatus Cybelea sp.]